MPPLPFWGEPEEQLAKEMYEESREAWLQVFGFPNPTEWLDALDEVKERFREQAAERLRSK